MRRAMVFVVGVVACGGAGDRPGPASPSSSGAPSSSAPSSDALERACAEQRQTGTLDRGCIVIAMVSPRTADCHYKGGAATATVHVKVTFAPDGTVPEAIVDLVQPPEAAPEVSACVVAKFRELRIPPFKGPPMHVGKSIDVR